jgi:thiosulfate dehydrogenase
MKKALILSIALASVAAAAAVASWSQADGSRPKHTVPASKDGNLVVGLCDGETAVEVPGVKEGETMPRGQAQSVADQLMAEWRRKNPGANWEEPPVAIARVDAALAATESPAAGGGETGGSAAAPTSAEVGRQEGIYSAFTERDEKVWMLATDQFVATGNKVFHDTAALGGTIGVSCDMCHPNAANTHPETYPKFQVQLGRVAMLRDMINWCIENPVRGKALRDDDVKMKALEAYILAQRKGVALDYGKH